MSDQFDKRTYMEDADEDGHVLDDTKTYVSGPDSAKSVKEEANTSRARREMRDSGLASPAARLQHESDLEIRSSVALERKSSKKPKESRDRDKVKFKGKENMKPAQAGKPSRPLLHAIQTEPVLQTSSSRKQPGSPLRARASPTKNTGPSPVSTTTTAGTAGRTRSYTTTARPSSYYGPSASRPIPVNAMPPHPNSAFGGSLPPPSPVGYPSPIVYNYPFSGPSPHPFAAAHADYFNQGPPRPHVHPEYRRPTSEMGHPFHHSPSVYSPAYGNDGDEGALTRKPTLKKRLTRQQQLEDQILMPPPGIRRPSTAAPQRTPFYPPREARRSISIASDSDDESVDDSSLYSASNHAEFEYQPIPARRPNIDPLYNESRFERSAGSKPRRRSSVHHGGRTQSTESMMNEMLQKARGYQDEITGPVDPLTTDSLRQMTKRTIQGARSTRSRDEGGYALTNRNSLDLGDDMRITVNGMATLTIGNTQMDVRDGAELRIPMGASVGNGTSRGGSDHDGSSGYDEREQQQQQQRRLPEDTGRRTRHERERQGNGRRATSRATSHPRAPPSSYYPQTEYGGSYYHPQAHPMGYAPPSGLPYPHGHF